MDKEKTDFKNCVYKIVAQIPKGRVMSYGQIAAICGSARSARMVGGIAHYGGPNFPWHRVVSKSGRLASGFPGGRRAHAQLLEAEGIDVIEDHHIDMSKYLWMPSSGNEGARGE